MTTAMTVPTPRRAVPAQVLHDWIDAQINSHFDQAMQKPGHAFSAYSITLELRQLHPDYEIVHEEVRQWGHYQMDNETRPYRTEDRGYIAYIPAAIVVSKPTVAQLPAGIQIK
jgi:hypothetical protein